MARTKHPKYTGAIASARVEMESEKKRSPVKEKKAKGRFHEGSTQVCAHKVSFYYRLPPRVRISKDELFRMTEAAEERAQECIVQGCVQGELNYETERFQATGWWRINNE